DGVRQRVFAMQTRQRRTQGLPRSLHLLHEIHRVNPTREERRQQYVANCSGKLSTLSGPSTVLINTPTNQDYFWNTIRFSANHHTEPCLPKAIRRRSVLFLSMENPSALTFSSQNAQLCSLM